MPSILIVVVRYQVPLDQSAAMQSLDRCLRDNPAMQNAVTTLIWDNSPSSVQAPVYSFPILYRHTGENLGVSGAYNRAMEIAEGCGAPWLLLLDQDTALPAEFLHRMLEHIEQIESDRRIAAVAPAIYMEQTLVSPKLTARFGGAVDFPPGFQGASQREVVLVNTGLLLRVAALRQIGGFSTDFWLDFSDRYLCHMLAKHRFSVWIDSELRLAHHISLMAGEGGMSEDRYANLLDAEDAYFSLYRSLPRNLVYGQRLLRNAWRERRTHPERSRLLMRHFVGRLTRSRRRRLLDWQKTAARRLAGPATHDL